MFQSVGVIDEIDRDRPDRAEPAVAERGVAVAFDFHEAAIPYVQKHAAAAMATAADAFQDSGCLAHGCGLLAMDRRRLVRPGWNSVAFD